MAPSTQRSRGAWMQTFSGGMFWPRSPRPEDWTVRDVAHALALQNRFAGHSLWPYSVAEHSVRASYIVPPEDALPALLHDTTETYGVDLPRPIKVYLPEYKAMERTLATTVEQWAGLPRGALGGARVKHADWVMLATEARDHMAPPPVPWEFPPDVEPLAERIGLWTPHGALSWLASLPFHVADAGGFRRGLSVAVREMLASGPWPWWVAERRFLARFAELTVCGKAGMARWTHTHACPDCYNDWTCAAPGCDTAEDDDGAIVGDPWRCDACDKAKASP